MAQRISDLPVGSLIKMAETVDGETTFKPYIVIAGTGDNPYGDAVLVIRKHVTGNALRQSNASVNYDGSENDRNTSIDARFDEKTLSHIMTSTVHCYNPYDETKYTIARKFFALSATELGGEYTIDDSTFIPYFSTAAKRLASSEGTTSGSYYFTRTAVNASSTGGKCVTNVGAIGLNVNGLAFFRPACNIYANTLVSDGMDSDGAYMLISDPAEPYLYAGFHCALGTLEKKPDKIRIDLTFEGTPEITLLQVCNNYGDTVPTWEDMIYGRAHTFTNTEKETENWEIGIKLTARSENTMRIYEPFAIVQTEG